MDSTRTSPRRTTVSGAVAHFGTNASEVVSCRVCGRTLLMGERSVGFFTERGEGPFDVCELCVPRAPRFGLRAQPVAPDDVTRANHRRRWLRFGRRARSRFPQLGAPPAGAAAVPVALAAFNQSPHARTLAGLQRTLGPARASVVPRSPTDREVILTVAWQIRWYQFRIIPDGEIEQTTGNFLEELPARWKQWNCEVAPDGLVAAPEPSEEATPPAVHIDPEGPSA